MVLATNELPEGDERRRVGEHEIEREPGRAEPHAEPELTRMPAASNRSRISLLAKPRTEKLIVVGTEVSNGVLNSIGGNAFLKLATSRLRNDSSVAVSLKAGSLSARQRNTSPRAATPGRFSVPERAPRS